ncbi:DUF7282 domain-containing protein [Natronosalvus caseinilyticus]|uniref:DUF7282 domain-containing protein n=1 Tax=Natronosalvus caseinilyticus TaxID=2953747 RepID=UPI0028AB0A00|nr:hypothetical protein [Natronosalvus caseinilyticus]
MKRLVAALFVGMVVTGLIVGASGLTLGSVPLAGPGDGETRPEFPAGGDTIDVSEDGVELVEFDETHSGARQDRETAQSEREAAEEGAERGIELAQAQGVNVTQEQREATTSAAVKAAEQYQDATVEQIQRAATGAVHGALLQHQAVNVTQLQSAVTGSADGALSQHQSANVTQMQNAAWGGAHGALDQYQSVTVEQIQYAARGAAAGAAREAGEKEVGHVGVIQEAAQGAAHGALEATKKQKHPSRQHVVQRQEITVEQIQHAAAGAAAGVVDGHQEQRVRVEQRQHATIKQVQTAALGAAKGALVQKQRVSVEQTQVAARGAAKGALSITQIQRVEITQIQAAATGAATGAIYQSQEATIEQIQAAAIGAARGTIVQKQAVHVTQIQYAARGAAMGAVESAIQYQSVTVAQIQAAAMGAGKGAVEQTQSVRVQQVQSIARGATKGVLSVAQEQRVTILQIQKAAEVTCQSVSKEVQTQRVTVEQVQRISERTAMDTTQQTVDDDLNREVDIRERAEASAVDRTAEEEPAEGEATVSTIGQTIDGETVTIDDVTLSEGGFVAVHDARWLEGERADSVIGVSEYLEPGEHESVTVTLFEDAPGAEYEVDALEAGEHSLFVVPYRDGDDDQEFDWIDTDDGADPPYVRQGGEPVVASIEATVAEERSADLEVTDQAGDGETVTVERATANVEFYVEASNGDRVVQSEGFGANETAANLTLDLDPPLGEATDLEVTIRAVEDGEGLESAELEYEVDAAVADEPAEATASLNVSDQTGDGGTLVVENVTATVDFFVEGRYDDEVVQSESFDADEVVENLTLELEPPLEETSDVEVAVRADDDDSELTVQTIEYVLEVPVAFLDCTTLEVRDAAAFDGASLRVSYLEGPFTGDEIDLESDDLAETVDGSIEDGAVLSTADLYPFSEFTHYVEFASFAEADDENVVENPNPATVEDCQELGFGERPTADVAFADQETDGTSATVDAVSLSEGGFVALYEAGAPVENETVLGVSEYLEPGEHENVTVDIEESIDEDRTLVTVVHRDLTGDGQFTFESVETIGVHDGPYLDEDGDPVADEAELLLSAEFAVSIADAPETVESDQPIELSVEVENRGAGPGEAPVVIDVGAQEAVVGESVALSPGETTTLTVAVDPPADAVGELELTVRVDDPDVAAPEEGSDSVTVTVEEAGEPAFEVTALDAPETVEAGEFIEVAAEVTNVGEAPGEAEVVFDIGGFDAATDFVSLSPDETATLVVTVETGPGDVGDLEIGVRTADDRTSTTVEVIGSSNEDDQQGARAGPTAGTNPAVSASAYVPSYLISVDRVDS